MAEVVARLRQYLGLLVSSAGWRKLSVALVVVLLAGMTDGIGLALLIPLLEMLDRQAPKNPLAVRIAHAMAVVDLPMTFLSLLGVFLLLVFLRSLLVRRREVMLAEIRQTFVSDLRIRLYQAIADASWSSLSGSRFSDLDAALLEEVDRVGQGTHFALHLPARAITLVVYLVMAFVLAPVFFLLAVLLGGGLVLAMRGRLHHSLRLGGTLAQASRKLHGDVREFLATVKVMKAHAAEDPHIKTFSSRVASISEQVLAFSRTQASGRAAQDIVGATALALFLWGGVELAHLPLPELLPMTLIFYRLLPLSQEFQQAGQQILFMLPSFVLVTNTYAQCEAAAEPAMDDAGAVLRLGHELRFDDVWFSYPGDVPSFILRGVNLVLPAGSLTVLSGPSGSGKSTALDLMLGLLEPVRGAIAVDGVSLSARSRRMWRRSIAYVPQDPVLFHDTIRANLVWSYPCASDSEIRDALRLAAAEFVFSLPDGLDTVVGERGLRLSGGERQRLALARALLRSPQLLLMDEPTSALDAQSEQLVAETIRGLKGKVTVVVVTHRPASFPGAVQLLSLVDGTLISLHSSAVVFQT